jgi:copper chaperone CopZ
MTSIRSIALAVALSCVSLVTLPALAHAKTVTEGWYVEGMHAAADARNVRDAARRLPGVTHVTVSLATVEVTFDNQKMSRAELAPAIAHAGNYRLMQRYE